MMAGLEEGLVERVAEWWMVLGELVDGRRVRGNGEEGKRRL
jgi:hypothetical protein